MPFSTTIGEHTQAYWDNHYEEFLKPIIEQTGQYKVHRSKPLAGDILKQIINDLIVSPLVVADVTDSNANVYWELGVRQSFSNGTITIAEHGTKLPFDLIRKGTHFYYPKDGTRNNKFIEDFQEAINKISANQCGPDSEILEAISGRGTLFEIVHRDETIRRVNGLIEETMENKNFLNTMNEALNKQVKVPLGYSSFQYSSLELLITQRYLEQDPELYSEARHLYLVITATNSAFSQYKDDWERLTKFFQSGSGLKSLEIKFVNFQLKLQDILKTLENIR